MSAREITVLRVYYRKDGCHDYDMRRLNFMPAPDRLALARALVADMPGVVVGMVPEKRPDNAFLTYEGGKDDGWNLCVSCMLANGEPTP